MKHPPAWPGEIKESGNELVRERMLGTTAQYEDITFGLRGDGLLYGEPAVQPIVGPDLELIRHVG